jgi:hypothetical protein
MPSRIIRAVAAQSSTVPSNWEYFEGPTTGVGVEYWLRNAADALEAYVCDDQGELRIEITEVPGNIEKPRAKVILVDWDTEGVDPTEEDVVEIADSQGNCRLATVTAYPVTAITDLAETNTLAALQAARIEGIP